MKLSSLASLNRRVMKKFSSTAVILMYHRVTDLDSDPWGLAVTAAHFAEQLEVLQELGQPMSLQGLRQACQRQKVPKQAVVVTFDDGYADNLYKAKTLLEHYNVPATVFLATGHLGSSREFWWDEIDRLFLQPGSLPETLALTINGRSYRWELGEAVNYSQEAFERNRLRKAWEGEPGSRLALYYSLWQLLLPIPEDGRDKLLDELIIWAGAEPAPRSTHRSLSLEEVATLAQSDLIEVGAHTVTHPFLSAHSVATQRHEIRQSKIDLEGLLRRPVTSFSYPHGERTAETVLAVQEAGFNCACTTVADSVWRRTDRFQLPRFEVGDWDGDKFAKRLLRWLHA